MVLGSPAGETEPTRLDDLELIVDADSHTIESPEQYLPYIEDDELRRIISRGDIARRTFSSTLQPSLSTHYSSEEDTGEIGENIGYSRHSKLSELDDFGIDKSVVAPTFTGAINTVHHPKFAIAIANAYNSWLLDEIVDPDEGLYGCPIIAPHVPERAAEEIDDRADEDGVVGIYFPPAGLTPPAGAARYDPIYQAAEDNGLPIVHHSTQTAMNYLFPKLNQGLQTYTEQITIGLSFPILANFVTTLLRGTPERFPDLDFVWAEAGLGWEPWWTWRIDDMYLDNNEEYSPLERLPSTYVNDQFYFTTQPAGHTADHPEHLAWALEMIGPENVMYSADLPHSTFDTPSEFFDRVTRYFDRETLADVMGRNAIDVFGLE